MTQVIGLRAWCDLVPEELARTSPGSVSITVHEVAVLADGRRIVLQSDRGFGSSGLPSTVGDPLRGLTADSIERDALTTVLPDEEHPTEEHRYDEFAETLGRAGLAVTADELRAVPYVVELSDRLRALLAHHQ
jgi:hypothetical protein